MFDNTSAKQLNNLYGQDVSGVQATLLGTRVAVAAVEAVGVGKVAKVGADAAAGGAKFIGDNANDAKTGNLSFLDAVRLNKATDDLINAAKSGKDIDRYIDSLADLTTHVNGGDTRVVVGVWKGNSDGFIGEATTNGGAWYQTPDTWYGKIRSELGTTEAARITWQVNQRVLQNQLESGHASRIDFVFGQGESSAMYMNERINPEIFVRVRAMEYRYLLENGPKYGYFWNENVGAFLRIGRPPGG